MQQTLDFEKQLAGRKILVTGHTGFTGGWVCTWLKRIGADVSGYALPPETRPSLFDSLGLAKSIPTTFADISDLNRLQEAVRQAEPDLILHLAAQPLVRRSYSDPVGTFLVNAQGTAHVLEAARHTKSVKGVVCVTTDKVYHNNEWHWPYRESDALGGKDPYSASKSAAEMVIQSYAASFPFEKGLGPAIAVARGGNIVGGGDWSDDRLIPDFVRSVTQNKPLMLRYPKATRPWQHVLALVHGYFELMARLLGDQASEFARPWNLGPTDTESLTVEAVMNLMSAEWTRPDISYTEPNLAESGLLALDSSLARSKLGWRPVWDTTRVIQETAAWYRAYYKAPESAEEITVAQIDSWRQSLLS
ncbi:CDP-glucose 4,6-dehydratase [Hydrogenophaga sp. 5NK40-0174]|uniref:CDP-glucose 4,6-dehydratase n=1 Tax=Hydrogenophaga sp. 5NK40-0174 TaxID=3127649 RepID=UPI00310B6173